MILTRKVILKQIEKKKLKIKPFKKSNVGPGSIDLTLDNKFRVFKKRKKTLNIGERTDYKKHTKKLVTDSIELKPGEVVLGITKEKLELPKNLCGWLQGRSRFARLGLSVHITASFVHPGSKNKQVLEIINMNNFPVKIKAGTKIVQLILEETEGEAELKGRFVNQKL